MSGDETRFSAGGRSRDTGLYAGEPPAASTIAPGDYPALVRPDGGTARSLLAGLAMALAVTAGYAAGMLRPHDCASLVPLSCVAGMVLAGVGVLLPLSGTGRLTAARVAVGLCLYLFLTDGTSIICVGDAPSLLVAIAWLSPVAVGGVVLPRRGAWLAGAGCWLVLFAASFALTYNVSHWTSGMSFFWRWVF